MRLNPLDGMVRVDGRGVTAVALVVLSVLAGGSIQAATIDEFPIPTANGDPANIVADTNGTLWFLEPDVDKIGSITATGVITEFATPAGSVPRGIAVGSDGNIWFTESTAPKIGRMTRLGIITEFSLPAAAGRASGITAGPDGNLWFTQPDSNRIGRITTAGVVTEFPLPIGVNRAPGAITPGPDGNLWFVEEVGNKIGKITRAGFVTEFAIPTPASFPADIVAADGYLWFVETDGNKIGRISTSGVITEFDLPTAAAFPSGIAAGAHAVWFTEFLAGKIGRITAEGVITEFDLPAADRQPFAVACGSDGNVWFTEQGANQIGRLRTALAKGDFDGDGQPDLIFRSLTNGAHNKLWLMNGVARREEVDIVPDISSADWIIRGADDFDSAASPGSGRDYEPDLVFWNRVSGNVEFWLMNGTSFVSGVPLTGAGALAPNWDLSATADFNHDGKPDIVWRDFVTQQIVIWTMNGVAKLGEIVPNPSQAIDSNWIVVAATDYNADGETDFLWYNFTSGKIVLWYMDANVVRITGLFTSPDAAGDSNWKVVASADYSGPSGNPGTPPVGSPDVVWRNETSGKQVIWHLDNAGVRVAGGFTSPDANALPLDWIVAGPR